MPEKSTPQSRGRNTASKALHGKSANPPSHAQNQSKLRSTTSSAIAVTRTPSVDSIASSIKSNSSAVSKDLARAHSHTPSQGAESLTEHFKVTKLSSTTVKLSSTWTPPAPPSNAPPPPPPQDTSTTDALQVAAQVYPWTYMTSTLDACFKSAEDLATKDLETRTKDLQAEEAEIADHKRSIEFYDEFGSELFAKEAPAIMQRFHSHGDSCAKIETEAMRLAARGTPDPGDDEPLTPYNDMLDKLEELQNEATKLRVSITTLTEKASEEPENRSTTSVDDTENESAESNAESTARQQIVIVFAACLPVIRARIANLSMAQELIDSALENVSLSLRMESLGIAD